MVAANVMQFYKLLIQSLDLCVSVYFLLVVPRHAFYNWHSEGDMKRLQQAKVLFVSAVQWLPLWYCCILEFVSPLVASCMIATIMTFLSERV